MRKENEEFERRAYSAMFETREDKGTGIITGRPIVYDSRTNLGWFDEVIDVGALDGADLTDVRLCLNHDTSYVYARSRRNNQNSTMRLNVTQHGLEIEAQLAVEESPRAKDFYSAVKRGDIDKMSFMFRVDGESWENLESDHPTRHITKISSVLEVSAVTFPAYDSTAIDARGGEALESARSVLERARQQNAAPMEMGELALAKAKFEFMAKL